MLAYPQGVNSLKYLLWVDDHSNEIVDMLERIEKEDDFQCDNRYSAKEAIDYLKREKVDILIVDALFHNDGSGSAPSELHEHLIELDLELDGVIIGPALILWVRKHFPNVQVCMATMWKEMLVENGVIFEGNPKFAGVSLFEKEALRDTLGEQIESWRA